MEYTRTVSRRIPNHTIASLITHDNMLSTPLHLATHDIFLGTRVGRGLGALKGLTHTSGINTPSGYGGDDRRSSQCTVNEQPMKASCCTVDVGRRFCHGLSWTFLISFSLFLCCHDDRPRISGVCQLRDCCATGAMVGAAASRW